MLSGPRNSVPISSGTGWPENRTDKKITCQYWVAGAAELFECLLISSVLVHFTLHHRLFPVINLCGAERVNLNAWATGCHPKKMTLLRLTHVQMHWLSLTGGGLVWFLWPSSLIYLERFSYIHTYSIAPLWPFITHPPSTLCLLPPL